MKLSVFSPVLNHLSLEEAMRYLSEHGVEWVELGCGGYPGKAHCDPDVLLHSPEALKRFRETLDRYGMHIAALSAHGNPVHPDPAVAKPFREDLQNAILLAEKLGVTRIVAFSGCPGGCPEDKTPNWAVANWPEDHPAIREYQWNEVLIPFWKETAAFAKAHGIRQIALEMHPGFSVYNPSTLLKLRGAVDPIIGANFDPSHLFWQGIDPVAAIRALGDALFFCHAKDTRIDALNCGVNGVLDTVNTELSRRSWQFRTVGYGHDQLLWKDIVSAMRMAGYDDVISIEHEDALMTPSEGLCKAIAFLKDVLLFDEN